MKARSNAPPTIGQQAETKVNSSHEGKEENEEVIIPSSLHSKVKPRVPRVRRTKNELECRQLEPRDVHASFGEEQLRGVSARASVARNFTKNKRKAKVPAATEFRELNNKKRTTSGC